MPRVPTHLPERKIHGVSTGNSNRLRKRRKSHFSVSISAALAALGLIALLAAGCDNHVEPIAPANPKIFNTMIGTDPVSLDPMMAQDQEAQGMVKQLFDGLVDYDPRTLQVVPAAAEKWESEEDGRVWIFHLRKGIKYHDASELTAADFKFGWSRVASRNSASPLFYLMEPIKGYEEVRARKAEEVEGVQELEGVKVVDAHTLRVELNYPFADFPKMLGHVAFSPVNKRTLDLSAQDFAERPSGNGPFEVASWRHGVEVIFDRFDSYYGTHAKIDRVRHVIYDDEDAAWEDFTQGALDETQIPAGRFGEIATDKEFKGKLHTEATLGLVYLGFNAQRDPYGGNTALRRAFNNAIDRDALTSRVEAPASPAISLLPSAIPETSEKSWPYLFDRQRASRELSAARAPGGNGLGAVGIGYNRESGHQPLVDALIRSLSASGIRALPQPGSFSAYREKLELGRLPVFLTGWIADYPAADAVLAPLFLETGTGDALGAMNVTRFRSPELTEALHVARGTMDDSARAILYQEIEEELAVKAPIVPLYELRTRRAVQPWVTGYVRTAFDDTPYALVDIDRESIAPAEHAEEGAHGEPAHVEEPAAEHGAAPEHGAEAESAASSHTEGSETVDEAPAESHAEPAESEPAESHTAPAAEEHAVPAEEHAAPAEAGASH